MLIGVFLNLLKFSFRSKYSSRFAPTARTDTSCIPNPFRLRSKLLKFAVQSVPNGISSMGPMFAVTLRRLYATFVYHTVYTASFLVSGFNRNVFMNSPRRYVKTHKLRQIPCFKAVVRNIARTCPFAPRKVIFPISSGYLMKGIKEN